MNIFSRLEKLIVDFFAPNAPEPRLLSMPVNYERREIERVSKVFNARKRFGLNRAKGSFQF